MVSVLLDNEICFIGILGGRKQNMLVFHWGQFITDCNEFDRILIISKCNYSQKNGRFMR
jgi:hypothetical protein